MKKDTDKELEAELADKNKGYTAEECKKMLDSDSEYQTALDKSEKAFVESVKSNLNIRTLL